MVHVLLASLFLLSFYFLLKPLRVVVNASKRVSHSTCFLIRTEIMKHATLLRHFRFHYIGAMARKRKQDELDKIFAEMSGRRETRAREALRLKETDISDDVARSIRNRYLDTFYTKVDLAAEGGQTVAIYILNLYLLWEHLASQCRAFADVLLTLHQQDLHFIVYHDEITPGNVLKPESGTKAHAFYIGAKQMGKLLSSESMWFVATVVRSLDAKIIQGKLAAVTAAVCKHFRHLRHGHAFHTYNVFVYGAVRHLLADTPALAFSFGAKTYAGRKVCFKCANIVAKWVALGPSDKAAGLRHVSAPWPECQPLTDNEIYEIVELLRAEAGHRPQSYMNSLESNLGYNHTPFCLWLDKEARELLPPSRCHFDWVHIFYSQGIASQHIFQLQGKLSASGWSPATIHDFAKQTFQMGADNNRISFKTVFSQGYFGENTWKAHVRFKICCLFSS